MNVSFDGLLYSGTWGSESFVIMEYDAMERIAEEVKEDMELERQEVLDQVLDEFTSCNSEQAENEVTRRLLDKYLDAYVKKFKEYIIFYYNLQHSPMYRSIVEIKDEKMVAEENEMGMSHPEELKLFLKVIEEERDMYEGLF